MNSSSDLYPYYYPTMIMFVDDNADFLTNFSLQLDPHLSYKLFDSPIKALSYINEKTAASPLYERCFTSYKEILSQQQPNTNLDLTLIEKYICHSERFEEISVAMIDYDMPGLDGLTLCEQIKNPRIKKVLLTGVADEKIAVQAFNDGIIDRFILKHERNAIDILNQTIYKMQEAYFQDIAHIIKNSLLLETNTPKFLYNEELSKIFSTLRKKQKITEFYLSIEPNGYLMMHSSGKINRLVVLMQNDLDTHIDIARDQGADQKLLDILKHGKGIPYFWDTIDGYYHSECHDWKKYIFPAQKVEGNETFYYALIDSLPGYEQLEKQILSFDAFLESVDSN